MKKGDSEVQEKSDDYSSEENKDIEISTLRRSARSAQRKPWVGAEYLILRRW